MLNVILLLVAMPFASQAQNPTPSQGSLQDLLRQAKTHQASISQALEAEAKKGAGFDPCRASLLDLQVRYDQWFIENASLIETVNRNILGELKSANQKLAQLKNMTVVINAVPGQNQDVTLTLSQIIEYFTNLNERLRGIDESRVSLLLDSQENPALNPLKVSHSQVLEAVKLLTQNLNASLREESTRYEIGFSKLGRSFSFEFKLVTTVENRELPFTISLLQGAAGLSLTESEIWNRLSRESFQLAGYSMDGRARYRQMRDKFLKKQCIEELNITFASTLYGYPYATFEQATAGKSFATQSQWVPLPPASVFKLRQAVLNPSGEVFALSTLNEKGLAQILKYDFATSSWIIFASGAIDKIEFSPDGGLYGRSTIENIYRYSAKNKYWSMVSAHRNAKHFWIMRDGITWMITREGHIGTPGATHLQNVESLPTKSIQVTGNDEQLYALSVNHQIHARGVNKVWESGTLPAAPSKIIQIASPRPGILMGLGEDGKLYSFSDSFWSLVVESSSVQSKIVQFNVSESLSIVGIDEQGKVHVLKEKQP